MRRVAKNTASKEEGERAKRKEKETFELVEGEGVHLLESLENLRGAFIRVVASGEEIIECGGRRARR